MAKKARTPSPPRKVQAPKRRDQPRPRRGPAPPGQDRSRLYLYAFAAAGIVGVIIAVFVAMSGNSNSRATGKVGVAVPNLAKLPGALTTPPPWPANNAQVKERAAVLGIPLNQPETVHYHAHLDIYDDGQHVTVPEFIGLSQQERVGAVLHTHATSGVIHIEGAEPYPYTLGQFFGIWGLNLNKRCIGGLCSKPLKVWVNGHAFNHDPTRLILEDHQEVVIAYGTPPTKVPSSFDWNSWNGA